MDGRNVGTLLVDFPPNYAVRTERSKRNRVTYSRNTVSRHCRSLGCCLLVGAGVGRHTTTTKFHFAHPLAPAPPWGGDNLLGGAPKKLLHPRTTRHIRHIHTHTHTHTHIYIYKHTKESHDDLVGRSSGEPLFLAGEGRFGDFVDWVGSYGIHPSIHPSIHRSIDPSIDPLSQPCPTACPFSYPTIIIGIQSHSR